MSLTDFTASAVAAIHISYFLFVAGGFVSIVLGAFRRWDWIRNPWFRAAHIAAVYVVIFEDIFHFACPLNTLEGHLRSNSGSVPVSAAGLVLDHLLYKTIPGQVLDAMYWSLAVLLIILLFLVKPRLRKIRIH